MTIQDGCYEQTEVPSTPKSAAINSSIHPYLVALNFPVLQTPPLLQAYLQ